MAKRGLKAKDIEKLENTSIAQALGVANPVGGDEQTLTNTCGDSCGCPPTNGCPTSSDSCGCPSDTCPSATCEPISVGSTACCDDTVRAVRYMAERLTQLDMDARSN